VPEVDSGLVDIIRDFLSAQELAGRVAELYREGELTFTELERFVEDGERSPLYRLKERCHALFRAGDGDSSPSASREELFDLAVGALFHEAMKLRENFYQQSVYGPKVEALRSGTDAEEAEVFREFEKILEANAVRLDEALQETMTLLEQTRRQFRRLLTAHRSNGLATRYLVESRAQVEAVFDEGLDAILAEIHGSAGEGYRVAAQACLASGYFVRALRALDEADRRLEARGDLAALRAYASGMNAYLDGRSAEALEGLARWLDGPPESLSEAFADLAHAAVERIARRTDAESPAVVERAAGLRERLEPLAPRARRAAATWETPTPRTSDA
jgi:hypothetical protein